MKVAIEFIFSKMTQASLGEGLINFRNEFLKTSYDTDLPISGLKLFHTLSVYGKKELAKYSALEHI